MGVCYQVKFIYRSLIQNKNKNTEVTLKPIWFISTLYIIFNHIKLLSINKASEQLLELDTIAD